MSSELYDFCSFFLIAVWKRIEFFANVKRSSLSVVHHGIEGGGIRWLVSESKAFLVEVYQTIGDKRKFI